MGRLSVRDGADKRASLNRKASRGGGGGKGWSLERRPNVFLIVGGGLRGTLLMDGC